MWTLATSRQRLHHNSVRRSLRLGVVVLVVLVQTVVQGPRTAAAAGPEVITVTARGLYGFQGWGTSLAWWANVIGGGAWNTVRSGVEDALFRSADDNQHLGLNVVRYNIGASPQNQGKLGSGCPRVKPAYQIPTTKTDPLANVSLNLDAFQVATLRDARSILGDAGVYEAFVNSPPWWLTNNHCVSGQLEPGFRPVDVLDTQAQVDAYVSYLIDVIDEFHRQGMPIDFDRLEPFNESGSDDFTRDIRWGRCDSGSCQEGAHFSRAKQDAVVAGLCRRLGQRGLPIPQISAPDGNSPDETADAFKAYGSFSQACVLQLNTHSYRFQQPYDGNRRRDVAALASGDRRVWMSEFGNGPSASGVPPETDINAGLTLADQVATDMKYLRPRAWVYWQAVEDTGGWGLLQIPGFYSNSGNSPIYTKRFYALQQYSRFIRPGYTIISADDPARDATDPREKATTVAAAAPDARRVVVVATNNSDAERTPNYDLSSLRVDTGDIHLYRTDDQGHNVTLDPVTRQMFNGRFVDLQPPHSITTYLVDLPNPAPGLPVTGTPPSTRLAYTGPTIADYHDTFTASATLTAGGSPVPNAPVTFTLGSGGTQTCTGTTNSSGSASCSLTPNQAAGPTTLTVSFAGTGDLPPTGTSVPFAITPEETTVAYVGPAHVANGVPANLSGVLKEDGAVPVAGRAVNIILGSGADQQTCSGTTDSAGLAICAITSVNQPLNDTAAVPVTVSFTGDAYYLPSTASATVRLEYYTGRAFGLVATVNLPLITVRVPPTPDTGPVRIAQASSTTTPCAASVSAIVIAASALCSNVTTRLAPGTSTAASTVADVTIGIPGIPVIEISGATATSTSTCGSATGSTALTLRIAGTPVTVPTTPNSEIDLTGAHLIINEQTPVPGADYGLTVNAAHLTVAGGVGDVVVASATSDVHNCS